MADSTNILNQIVVAQAQPAVPANELFASMSPAAMFSRNESASSLLTWAYYGGYYNGISLANGTLTLTASQANIYIVAKKSDGVVSFSTATTNYDNTTDYDRLYRVTTSGTAATVWEDKRQLIGASASGGGGAFTGGTLTSALNEAPIVTIASAATVNIGAAAGNTISVTGTTGISAFDTIASGAVRRVVFNGALLLTHNATSLILPTGANITTAAGDAAIFLSLGSGNWRCVDFSRASGAPLAGASPGGSTTQVQYNNAGAFAGSSNLVWDNGGQQLKVGVGVSGDLVIGGSTGLRLLASGSGGSFKAYGVDQFTCNGTQTMTFNATPVMPAGGVTTSGASMRLPHGSAPSTPTNGDMWTTTAGLYVRINGATVGPLT